MPGIKLLRSSQRPPWGAILAFDASIFPSNSLIAPNMVFRFFTPATTTEIGKMILPTTRTGVHLANDTTNVVASADATDLATAITLANEIKADYNTHIASTTFHSNADGTNVVTSADATDEASLVTLVNEIKADYNAHLTQATVHPHDDYINIVTIANATATTSAIQLANEIKADYNSHRLTQNLIATGYGIAPGTHDVGFKADICASRRVDDLVFVAGQTTLVTGVVRAGDTSGNDAISALDTAISLLNTGVVGQHAGYPGDWKIPEQTEFGVWTVTSTARRRTY